MKLQNSLIREKSIGYASDLHEEPADECSVNCNGIKNDANKKQEKIKNDKSDKSNIVTTENVEQKNGKKQKLVQTVNIGCLLKENLFSEYENNRILQNEKLDKDNKKPSPTDVKNQNTYNLNNGREPEKRVFPLKFVDKSRVYKPLFNYYDYEEKLPQNLIQGKNCKNCIGVEDLTISAKILMPKTNKFKKYSRVFYPNRIMTYQQMPNKNLRNKIQFYGARRKNRRPYGRHSLNQRDLIRVKRSKNEHQNTNNKRKRNRNKYKQRFEDNHISENFHKSNKFLVNKDFKKRLTNLRKELDKRFLKVNATNQMSHIIVKNYKINDVISQYVLMSLYYY